MDLSINTGIAIGLVHEYSGELQTHYPGLLDALEKADKYEISTEVYARQILNSLKDTPEFLGDVRSLDPGLSKNLLDFMDGKSAEEVTRGGFKLPLSSEVKHHLDEMSITFEVGSLSILHQPLANLGT